VANEIFNHPFDLINNYRLPIIIHYFWSFVIIHIFYSFSSDEEMTYFIDTSIQVRTNSRRKNWL